MQLWQRQRVQGECQGPKAKGNLGSLLWLRSQQSAQRAGWWGSAGLCTPTHCGASPAAPASGPVHKQVPSPARPSPHRQLRLSSGKCSPSPTALTPLTGDQVRGPGVRTTNSLGQRVVWAHTEQPQAQLHLPLRRWAGQSTAERPGAPLELHGAGPALDDGEVQVGPDQKDH